MTVREFEDAVALAIAEDDPGMYDCGDMSNADIDRLAAIAAAAYERVIEAARPAPAGTTDADYAEASRILGRNALVETDAPEAIAAARAVCDAYTGIARPAPASSEDDEA